MAINFTNLTADVKNIQALSDKPNETDGLTAQGLKERFDKAGTDIKNYINGTHLPELERELGKQNQQLEANKETIIKNTSDIEDILNKMQWKYIGTTEKTNTINLPSEYNELYIKVVGNKNPNASFAFVIPKEDLLDTEQGYNNGYYRNTTGTSAMCRISLTKTQGYLSTLWISGTEYVNNSDTYWYYR